MDIRRVGAVILAGGAATRLGGRDKPGLAVAGTPMLDRVLAAVEGACARVVVGPWRAGLPSDVVCVREEPPGGGPAAAAVAGLAALGSGGWGNAEFVALLAADLPYLTSDAVNVLAEAVAGGAGDGAVYVDDAGRRQLLCGVWRTGALVAAVAGFGDPAGRSMRSLVGRLEVIECRAAVSGTPPWYDCDTEEDLRRAEEAGEGR